MGLIIGNAIDEAIDFFGEENFDKTVEELPELADSVNSK